jgi:hypothetical protein
MSSTGSNVSPDIIVFPPDQLADITDEERAVLMRFKDFLATDRARKMKTQIRERLIQRLWGTGSKVASRVKENDFGTCAMLSSSSSGAAPESARRAAGQIGGASSSGVAPDKKRTSGWSARKSKWHKIAASEAEMDKWMGQCRAGSAETVPRIATTGSVEQPAHTPAFNTLTEVSHWMDNLAEADRNTLPVRRVSEALKVLDLEVTRDRQRQLQGLLKSWDIKRRETSNKKRSVREVHQCLAAAVLAEGNRLQTIGITVGSFSNRSSFDNLFRSRSPQLGSPQLGSPSSAAEPTPSGN